jgi:MurNAc alpha-1-phosphate uridylyltransferase
LLDYVFDHLRTTDVKTVTVNTHHLPDKMRDYLGTVTDFSITESYEPVLLETGGGLVKTLPTLGDKPFFMINGDAFWVDNDENTLQQLAQQFDETEMDILLCLIPVSRMVLTEGVGDYDVMPDGRIRRNLQKQGTHMFTGLRVMRPSVMDGFPEEKFSFLKNMDEAEAKGRLYGYVMSGDWHHISTPEDLKRVEDSLAETLPSR